jgi:hypothetical protein
MLMVKAFQTGVVMLRRWWLRIAFLPSLFFANIGTLLRKII